MDRKSFLESVLAAAAFSIVPSAMRATESFMNSTPPAMGALVPSTRKVNLACIGIGNRGGEIMRELASTHLANIVAICDVDMGAPQTKSMMDAYPDVPRYQDFRVMLKEMGSEIEAVSIGVPDHSHFVIAMAAMRMGKHVYVEKPLARTFRENELLIAAAKKHKVVTQMGNQGHSEANYFQFKAWKEAGIIKNVRKFVAHMNNSRRWHPWDPNIKAYPAAEAIPSTLDWDIWTNSAKELEYNKLYTNGDWRCWYQFGMGALGDWGAHIMDTVHEFMELGLPTEVTPLKLEGHNDFFYPMKTTLEFKFPARGDMPPMTIEWYDGIDNLPEIPAGYGVSSLDPDIPLVAGEKIEKAHLNPGKIIYTDTLTFKGATHGATLEIIPKEKAEEMERQLPYVPKSTSNHYENFLLACQGVEESRSPFHISGRLAQVFSLGVLAQWTGEKIVFDPKSKQITNSKLANDLLSNTPRSGWESYYEV